MPRKQQVKHTKVQDRTPDTVGVPVVKAIVDVSTAKTTAAPAPAVVAIVKDRCPLAQVVDIRFPPTRIRNYFVPKFNDPVLVARINEIKSELSRGFLSESKKNDLVVEFKALEKNKIRTSPQSYIALAISVDTFIMELVEFAMNSVLLDNKKRVSLRHLFTEDWDKLTYFPLYGNIKYVEECRIWLQSASNVISEDDESKTSLPSYVEIDYNFHTYIKQIFQKIKQSDDKFKDVSLSTDVRRFLSQVVFAFIDRTITPIEIMMKSDNLHTVKDRYVLNTIKIFISDGHSNFTELEKTVSDKLARYVAHTSRKK